MSFGYHGCYLRIDVSRPSTSLGAALSNVEGRGTVERVPAVPLERGRNEGPLESASVPRLRRFAYSALRDRADCCSFCDR